MMRWLLIVELAISDPFPLHASQCIVLYGPV
jgi:hypothetical protein